MVDAETVIIIVIVIVFALSFGCCCHFMSGKRRQEELSRRNSPQTQQTAVDSTANANASHVYVLHLRDTSSNNPNANPTGGEAIENPEGESQEDSHDPIVESGPPPYSGIEAGTLGEPQFEEPQLPPPSYEEALSLTVENLATPREEMTE